MPQYLSPSFTAIPMAMICSKSGCPTPRGPFAVGASSVSAFGLGGAGNADPLIAVPQDISTRADGAFTYVYEPGAQLVFELNEVAGSIIGQCVVAPRRLAEVVTFVQGNYQNYPGTLADEVFGFLLNLKASGFNLTIA